MQWIDFFSLPFLLFYLFLCLPIAIGLCYWMPYRYRFPLPGVIAFFYLLSASLFGVGIIISLLIAVLVRTKSHRMRRVKYSIASYPDYQKSPQTEHKVYGEGSAYKMITSQYFLKDQRQKILAALNQYGISKTNEMNRLALQDEVEEVRLYAQIFIEKQEREITSLLKSLIYDAERTQNKTLRARYEKKIALMLWEQVYQHLYLEESLPFTLQKIKNYAMSAFEQLPEDIDLPLLIAKTALRENQLDEAFKWFNIAKQNQAPDYKVQVYLAEIAYRKGHFSQIPGLLNPIKNEGIMSLTPLLSFWVPYD